MNRDRNSLIEILTLTLTDQKRVVESSYFFHQLYTRLGIFESINFIIQELSGKNYISNDGNFGVNSGLIKNITLTNQGKAYLEKSLSEKTVSDMETEFENFEIVKDVIYSKLQNLNG